MSKYLAQIISLRLRTCLRDVKPKARFTILSLLYLGNRAYVVVAWNYRWVEGGRERAEGNQAGVYVCHVYSHTTTSGRHNYANNTRVK